MGTGATQEIACRLTCVICWTDERLAIRAGTTTLPDNAPVQEWPLSKSVTYVGNNSIPLPRIATWLPGLCILLA